MAKIEFPPDPYDGEIHALNDKTYFQWDSGRQQWRVATLTSPDVKLALPVEEAPFNVPYPTNRMNDEGKVWWEVRVDFGQLPNASSKTVGLPTAMTSIMRSGSGVIDFGKSTVISPGSYYSPNNPHPTNLPGAWTTTLTDTTVIVTTGTNRSSMAAILYFNFLREVEVPVPGVNTDVPGRVVVSEAFDTPYPTQEWIGEKRVWEFKFNYGSLPNSSNVTVNFPAAIASIADPSSYRVNGTRSIITDTSTGIFHPVVLGAPGTVTGAWRWGIAGHGLVMATGENRTSYTGVFYIQFLRTDE